MKPLLLVLAVAFAMVAAISASEKPNFLIIVADDCTYNDLPLYGGQNAKTPHIDALAARGLTFNRAFLAEAMCQPCRAELYTGQYPMRNGCAWNHSASKPGTKSLPHYLKPLGYRVGLAGKGHVKPAAVFPFENIEGFDPSCVREPTQAHDVAGIAEFMERESSPFCLVVALVEPHVPWVMGDATRYPPASLNLPPNLADTPATREHFANYLAEITYMDGQVGEILETLKDSGREEETVVIFTSEQGSQFPGCKWTNWNTGLHTAFVASLPGQIEEGKRTDALIQYADLAPTLIELAGGEISGSMKFDGSSFASVLKGASETHREFAYGMHNNLPEGPAYPIRTITNGKFRYIRNLAPDELYIEKHLMGGGRLNNPYWATWVGADPMKPESGAYPLIKRYMSRPAEELYLTVEDPYELENLAGNPEYVAMKAKLSDELEIWMNAQNDPGKAVDTPAALKAARKGAHLYGVD